MEKIKIGILGCANVARKHAIPAFQELEIAELKAIASRDREKAAKWAEEFSIPIHGTYDEIIKNKEIDAVYIALPTGLHEEWAVKAAITGKHILCEKSLSDSYESVSKIIEACKKNSVVLFENFMCAYHPQHEKTKQVAELELGDIHNFTGFFGIPHLNKENFRYKKELGGGSLNDLGAYLVFMSRFFFGEPTAVTCSLDFQSGTDMHGSAILEFQDRRHALISFGLGKLYQSNYSLWGSNGLIKVNRAYSIPKTLAPDIKLIKNENLQEISKKIEFLPAHQFLLGFKAFCEAVLSNNLETKNKKYEEILSQAKVLQAMRDSARTKQRIEIT